MDEKERSVRVWLSQRMGIALRIAEDEGEKEDFLRELSSPSSISRGLERAMRYQTSLFAANPSLRDAFGQEMKAMVIDDDRTPDPLRGHGLANQIPTDEELRKIAKGLEQKKEVKKKESSQEPNR